MTFARVPRLGRYVAVGFVNTAVSTVVFLVLHRERVDVSLAGALGFLAGALTSYVLNRAWTFGDGERRHGATAWRFAVVTLVGLSFTALLLRIAVRGFGLPPLAGQLVTVVLVTGVTYVLSRRWAFAPGARAFPRIRPELVAVLVLAGVLNLWALDRNGWANVFYAAAVRSMSANWHDFLWASFDPNGVMTLDKPPLAFWVQTISARTFGYHPLSLLVPQALMGVATVGLVYDLTCRRWGRAAGAAAGAVLALTPITVALSRHNNPDALLILLSVGAVWCTVRGLQRGGTGWILGAGLCVGLAFETKMAAALLVVPGLALAWFWVAPRGRWTALWQLAVAGALVVVIGGAWMTAAALTPAASRPWIGGTTDNSAYSLAFGYNGLGRVGGQAGGPQAAPGASAAQNAARVASVFGGHPGAGRLLDPTLGPQGGWLLGFAVVGGVLIAVLSRLRRRDERTGWLIAVGGAFATIAVVFSTAEGIFHPYYVSLLAPFTAALVGAGAAAMVRRRPLALVFAVVAIGAAAAGQLLVLGRPGTSFAAWAPYMVAACIVGVVALLVLRGRTWRLAVLGAVLAALLVAPAAWSVGTLGHPTAPVFPIGGPRRAVAVRAAAPPPARPRARRPGAAARPAHHLAFATDPALSTAVRFARTHGGGSVSTMSQYGAAPRIIRGDDVVGLGGFSGRESVVSIPWLAQRVSTGAVRWILLSGRQQRRLERVVRAACPYDRIMSRQRRLYDCRGRGPALLRAAVAPRPVTVNAIHTVGLPPFTRTRARSRHAHHRPHHHPAGPRAAERSRRRRASR